MSASIGSLRHRLTLQVPVTTPDGAGGGEVAWTAVATMWAAVRPLGGDEVAVADGQSGRVTHEIVIRYRADVTGAMRFVSGARVFAIRSAVDPYETGAWLRCLTEETRP